MKKLSVKKPVKKAAARVRKAPKAFEVRKPALPKDGALKLSTVPASKATKKK